MLENIYELQSICEIILK